MSSNNVDKPKEKKKAESKTLNESGCAELYEIVQKCVDKEEQWITCAPDIRNFRACMLKYRKERINKKADLLFRQPY